MGIANIQWPGSNDPVAITPDWSNITNKPDLNLKANVNSPELTGKPLAPTATTDTNDTQIATTAFVHSVITASLYTGSVTNTPQI